MPETNESSWSPVVLQSGVTLGVGGWSDPGLTDDLSTVLVSKNAKGLQ